MLMHVMNLWYSKKSTMEMLHFSACREAALNGRSEPAPEDEAASALYWMRDRWLCTEYWLGKTVIYAAADPASEAFGTNGTVANMNRNAEWIWERIEELGSAVKPWEKVRALQQLEWTRCAMQMADEVVGEIGTTADCDLA